MYTDNINSSNIRGLTFGYKIPSCVTPKRINRFADNIKYAQGLSAYNEYLRAINNFKNRRFNAKDIIEEYLPKILEYGDIACNDFRELCKEYHIPKKQSLLSRIFGQKPDIKNYDFKNIDIKLGMHRSFADFYTGTSAKSTLYIKNIKTLKHNPFCESEALLYKKFSSVSDINDVISNIEKIIRTNLEKQLDNIIKNAERTKSANT